MSPVPGAPTPGERLRTLRGLAGYACGHTGSCCHAGWPIPIEPAPLAVLRRAELEGALDGLSTGAWSGDDILGHTAEHHCVFHAADELSAGCRIETALGSDAMPFSCRQFPRVLLRDARGWHLSVSAWCGTAAALMASGTGSMAGDDEFLVIDHIDADPRVHVEALDAREAWPPFLKPGILAGHQAYERWEERLLSDVLMPVARSGSNLGPQLAGALCWTDRLRQWRAAEGALLVLMGKPWVPRDRSWLHLWHMPEHELDQTLLAPLMALVPTAWQVPDWPLGLTDADLGGGSMSRSAAETIVARYLATRLMGSWVTYQGEGLRSVLASLTSAYGLAALALARNGRGPVTIGRLTSAVRAADWLLLHLLDRDQWASWCSRTESASDSGALIRIVAGATALLDGMQWADAGTASR